MTLEFVSEEEIPRSVGIDSGREPPLEPLDGIVQGPEVDATEARTVAEGWQHVPGRSTRARMNSGRLLSPEDHPLLPSLDEGWDHEGREGDREDDETPSVPCGDDG